jgi:UDP-glucose 4-epimerase
MPGPFHGTRTLITGGLGFIGSNLAMRLLDAGARVTVIDSLVPAHGGNTSNVREIADRLSITIADVRDGDRLRPLLEGQDIVFNLAGQASHIDSMKDPFVDLDMNVRAQLAILEACRAVNPDIRVVFASTRQVYGRADYLPVDETHPLRPVDVNGVHKMAAEAYHRVYQNVYGIRTCCLRLTNTYGPRMRIKDGGQTFLGLWIRRALEREPFEVWDGRQLRDFTYVDDVVDALMLATRDEAVGRVMNLGGAEVVSLRQLAALLVTLWPGACFEIRDFPAARRRIDVGDFHSSFELARTTLGWRPSIALRDGLTRTLEYFAPRMKEYV